MTKRKGVSPFFVSLAEFYLCLAFAAMGVLGTQLHAEQEAQARKVEAARKSQGAPASSPVVVTLALSSAEIDGMRLENISDLHDRVHGSVVIKVSDDVPAKRLKEALGYLPADAAVSVATDSK